MSECFVCDKHLQRCNINDDFSREDFATIVRKIIGDDYLLIFGEDDHLCQACQNLLLRIVRLEVEEKNSTLAMRVLLQMKYSLDFSNEETQDDNKEYSQKILQSVDDMDEHCFVCDQLLRSSDFKTDYSRNDLICIIRKIVGEGHFVVIKDEDHLCQACQDLMLKIRSKGAELRTMTLAMRALLRIKYSLDFHNAGMLGSSVEDCSMVPLERQVTRSEDLSALFFKKRGKKVYQTKSTSNSASLRDLFRSNISLITGGVLAPKQAVLKKKRKRSGVSSLKTDPNKLNSNKSLVPDSIEIDLKVEEDSVNESSPPAVISDSQEDFDNQSLTRLLQEDSHHESVESQSENINSENKTETGSFRLRRKKGLMKHKVSKPYKCSRCKFKYSTPEELESHNLEMKNNKDYYCKICDFSFHLKNLIKQHKSNHSPVNLKRECKLCNQSIYDRLHLRYHMFTIHSGEKAHKCSHCSRSFIWRRQLKKHLYKCHEKKPAFTCDKCKKVYADKVKYLKHIEFFHRSSYCCKVCFKSFRNIDSLCLHERNHTKIITIYKCQYCFKKYRTPENRRQHEEQHSGNFKYKCGNCGLGFDELIRFEKHKAKNTCARSLYGYINHPTMCEICGKIYSNRITFKNHHLLHYNPQPFECDICFKKLRYKGKLYYHKKRYHPQSLASTCAKEST